MEIHRVIDSESIWLTIGALLLTLLLGLPCLAYLKKDATSSLPDGSMDPDSAVAFLEKDTESSENKPYLISPSFTSRSSHCSISWVEAIFFGVNYVVWVILATGYSACSKAYMAKTESAIGLLAFQGWVGIGVLLLMNCFVQCQRRFSSAFQSSAPSWQGKCGLNNTKSVGWNVWVAGIFYSINALLTSWSVLVGGVALTQALKAFEPVVAAGLSRCMLGTKLSSGRLVAISVIVLGLMILMVQTSVSQWFNRAATKTSAHNELPAFITAIACCAVAMRNIFLKWSTAPSLPPPLALLACSMLGAAIATTALLVLNILAAEGITSTVLVRVSGVNTALCFVGFNFASFNLLSELSPVGHAVGNSSKRMILFVSGLLMLGERKSMSSTQLVGASISFLGLVWYSIASKTAKSPSPPSDIQLIPMKALG